jgi:hypothetical protein
VLDSFFPAGNTRTLFEPDTEPMPSIAERRDDGGAEVRRPSVA